jgi:Mrp family chromosome partitioning ATPase
VLVVRYGKTKREQVQDMATALRTVDAHLLGTILNIVPAKRGNQYYYEDYGPTAKAQTLEADPRAGGFDPRQQAQYPSEPMRTREVAR